MPERIYSSESPNNDACQDSVTWYLQAIEQTPLLDAQQEVALAKTMEIGATAEAILLGRQQARDEAQGIVYLTAHERVQALGLVSTTARVPRERAIYNDVAYTTDLMKRFPEESVNDEALQMLSTEGQHARAHFILANLPLAFNFANRYGAKVPLLEKVQWANLGLIRAVDKFDYTKGFKFSTHAAWWIRESLSREAKSTTRLIRLPVEAELTLGHIKSAQEDLSQELGRPPTHEELAEKLKPTKKKKLTAAKIAELLRWQSPHFSLQQPIEGAGESEGNVVFADVIHDDNDPEDLTERRERLAEVLLAVDKAIADPKTRAAYINWALGDSKNMAVFARQQGISTQMLDRKFTAVSSVIRDSLQASCEHGNLTP